MDQANHGRMELIRLSSRSSFWRDQRWMMMGSITQNTITRGTSYVMRVLTDFFLEIAIVDNERFGMRKFVYFNNSLGVCSNIYDRIQALLLIIII